MKGLYIGVLVSGLLLTSCGAANAETLAEVMAAHTCVMEELRARATGSGSHLKDVGAERKAINDRLDDQLRASFAAEGAMDKAIASVGKEAFGTMLTEKAKAKCNASDEAIADALSEF